MNRDTKGLHQRTISQGDMHWQLVAALGRDFIEGRQCSVVRGSGREDHGFAKIVMTTTAVLAGVAGYAGLKGNTVAHLEPVNVATAGDNHTRRLVAQDDWSIDCVSSYSSMLPVVDLQ